MREPIKVPSLPPDFTSGDGVSWPRLITALVLLALSLVMGYRSTDHPPPPKAEPHSVRDQLVVSAELPPLEAEMVSGPTTVNRPPTKVPPVEVADPHPAVAGREEHALHRQSLKHAGLHRHGERRLVARTGTIRSRAEVRREYFRDRDFVAALTGEDSGSVYLTRTAAEQREAFGRGRHPSVALRSARS
jgi:hypothetical protein